MAASAGLLSIRPSAGLLIALALPACGFLKGQPVASVRVAAEPALVLVQRDPYLYRVIAAGLPAAFFTAIQDCRRRSVPPIQSLTRQLLVGLKEPQILDQTSAQLGGSSAMRSRVAARYEQRRLMLVTYTIDRGGCLRDYVFWLEGEPQAADQPALAAFDALVRNFIDEQ